MSLASNTAAYWKLDESSGDATDATGNGYTLTNNNTSTYVAGKINNGISGNGTNQCLTRDGNTPGGITYSQFGTAWSMSCWVKPNSSSADLIFLGMQVQSGSSQRRNLYLVCDANVMKVKVFDGSSNTYTTGQTISNGTFYFVALTYDGTDIKVYLDNSLVLTQAKSFSFQGDAQAGGFGILCERQNNGSFNHFNGVVDEVGTYNVALSASEVSQLYNGGVGIQYPFTSSVNSNFFMFFN